ncbi:hypothetical protein BRD17_08210 [Halobacteriales archaeon SW_7_68_16]|nr:MAG: hypothetical protein BRD17_08210 [Halobacteriales archaeon SW_7_68_16]
MGILTRFGVGNATVDLHVPDTVEQGERVAATVEAEGGSDSQEIEGVYAAIEAYAHDASWSLGNQRLIDEPFTIEPDDHREFDVELVIPVATPVTELDARGPLPSVAIATGMDIDLAVDPDDEDPIAVRMGGPCATFHDAVVDHLGFKLHEVDDEQMPGLNNYTQELIYHPHDASGDLAEMSKLEAALDYTHDGDGLQVRMEFEKGSKEARETMVVADDESASAVAKRLRSVHDDVTYYADIDHELEDEFEMEFGEEDEF